MKTTLHSILLLFGILAFTACQKEDNLTFTERRVVGTWNFEKVKVYDRWSFNTDEITSDYDREYITFNNDFTAIYEDLETGEIFSGVWNLTENNSGDYCVSNIFASFTNDETGDLMQVIFEDISVTKKRLRAQFENKEERFNYLLLKQ